MTKLEFLDRINDILIGLNTAESDALGSLYDELMSDAGWHPASELPKVPKDELIICECGSAEHQMVLHYDDDKDLGRQVFVEIHLVPLVWYKRLWHGLKYIFGYKCCYGNFEEMILSPKHARQVYDIYEFLNKPNLNKPMIDTPFRPMNIDYDSNND